MIISMEKSMTGFCEFSLLNRVNIPEHQRNPRREMFVADEERGMPQEAAVSVVLNHAAAPVQIEIVQHDDDDDDDDEVIVHRIVHRRLACHIC
jgi:hypothetical protein